MFFSHLNDDGATPRMSEQVNGTKGHVLNQSAHIIRMLSEGKIVTSTHPTVLENNA